MDSIATSGSGNGRCKKVDKTRRSWSAREEDALIQSLKEVITKSWKSENDFRAGYLTLLDNAMQTAIPGTNLRGNPNINSKIHVWKKTYSSLVTLLTKSGVGWSDNNNIIIDVTYDTWESIVKNNPTLRMMRHKEWTPYNDWYEIFGNDRETGDHSKNFEHAQQKVPRLDDEVPNEHFIPEIPSSNLTVSKTRYLKQSSKPIARATLKTKKRNQATDSDESIVEAINNLAHKTKDTMAHLLKEMTAEDKLWVVQGIAGDDRNFRG